MGMGGPGLDRAFFTANRRRLCGMLPLDAVAVVHSNDLLLTNADGVLKYEQNSDLFYLTGILQEGTVLVLQPGAVEPGDRERLFLLKPDETVALWEGDRLGRDEATAISGVESVLWVDDYDRVLRKALLESRCVYLDANEHPRAPADPPCRNRRMGELLRRLYPLHEYRRLAPLVASLRVRKDPAEVAMMRHACGITRCGFLRALRVIAPGVSERAVEAEFAHEFIRSGAGFGYLPIVASGRSSCVLHYTRNDRVCREGDLALLDVGARYGGYHADMTRVVPVSGRFSRRQRAVYDAVLRVMRSAMEAMVPGAVLRDIQKRTLEWMGVELAGLGLADTDSPDEAEVKRYFMHGVSHPLGIDVHDVGDMTKPIEPGWVLTCEPGIYLPDEGFGIRLETNVLVDVGGPVDLMADIPVEAGEIEEMTG